MSSTLSTEALERVAQIARKSFIEERAAAVAAARAAGHRHAYVWMAITSTQVECGSGPNPPLEDLRNLLHIERVAIDAE